MRTIDVIDAELRLLVVIRKAARAAGGQPSTAAVDELLDERLRRRADTLTRSNSPETAATG